MSRLRFSRVLRVALAALPLVLFGGVAKAGTLNFDFSVTNNPGTGNVPGTFTGEIFGLSDNAFSAASSVVIQSIPTGMNNLVSPPIDATTWNDVIQNLFQVVNGQVVGGGFYAQQTIGGFSSGYQLYINGTTAGFNFLNLDGVDHAYVEGDRGLAAANIVPVPSSVIPEPASYVTALLGAVWVAGYTWRRKVKTASA